MGSLTNFIEENKKSGGSTSKISKQVKQLWNEYKLPSLQKDCSIICAEFGNLGSLVIRRVKSFDDNKAFKYESGNYDYISIISDQEERILWTDYKEIQPYNRSGGLYCSGASFEHLGKPVVEKKEYREFNSKHNYTNNIMFAVHGYDYNSYYKSIQFGICIETSKVKEFIDKLRVIIDKNN